MSRRLKLGNEFLSLGWYTYDFHHHTEPPEQYPVQIYGATNPVLTLGKGMATFEILRDWFAEVFEDLWNRAATPATICLTCPDKLAGKCTVSQEWLDLVSRQ